MTYQEFTKKAATAQRTEGQQEPRIHKILLDTPKRTKETPQAFFARAWEIYKLRHQPDIYMILDALECFHAIPNPSQQGDFDTLVWKVRGIEEHMGLKDIRNTRSKAKAILAHF